MSLSVEPFRIYSLSHLECGQLMKQTLDGFKSVTTTEPADPALDRYVAALSSQAETYEKALVRVRKSEDTLKIQQADEARNQAIYTLKRTLQLYAGSDLTEEAEAARSLQILVGSFGRLTRLNYEAESIAIDKLLADLAGPNYNAKAAQLQLDRVINRLLDTNETFKTLFGHRIVTAANTETYDVRALRKEMTITYNDLCGYVLAMAKAHGTEPYLSQLELINTARKYYSDFLARRNSTRKTTKQKEETKKADG